MRNIPGLNSYGTRLLVAAAGFLALAAFGTLGVGAHHVTIDDNLSVTPNIISFSTVFPGEVHLEPINIDLSSAFLEDPELDDVEYRILQKPKPRIDSEAERAYCQENPTDYERCYRSLCPYLSKTPDGTPANDTGVPAFHDPNDPASIAYGRLAKSDNDLEDEWVIDLHVPCFAGQCDQTNSVAPEYQLDPSLNGEVFGCDLIVEVFNISFTEFDVESVGTAQFTLRQTSHPGVADDQFVEIAEFHLGGPLHLASDAVTITLARGIPPIVFSQFTIPAGAFTEYASVWRFEGELTDAITGKSFDAVVRFVKPARPGEPYTLTIDTKDADYTALEGNTHELITLSLAIGPREGSGEQCFKRVSDGDLYFPATNGITCIPMPPPVCYGLAATIWVDSNGIIHGGPDDGELYNNVLNGTEDQDVIVGVDGGSHTEVINGKGGDDVICGRGGKDDLIKGGSGNDRLFGGDGQDEILGGPGDDYIDGGFSNDILKGEDGNDTIIGGEGNDQADGGEGNDTMYGGPGGDNFKGGLGNDVIYLENGNDIAEGGPGNDTIYGGSGSDLIKGQNGDDILYGENGNDRIEGGLGNDTLFGGDGNDKLESDQGNDILHGENGDDELFGGAGNDLLIGGAEIDLANGGPDTDTCDAETEISCEL